MKTEHNRTGGIGTDARVTVVIPNYNGKNFLMPCLRALSGQSFRDFEVLIVDNGSSDGSAEVIKALSASCGKEIAKNACGDGGFSGEKEEAEAFRFPVRGICLSENTGFSGAVNVGIEAARGEYVVLLNNDTEAKPGYLEALVRVLDADSEKKIFAVSPKMIQLFHKELIDDAGDGYNLLGWGYQRGVGQSVDSPGFRKSKEVFSACAGAAAYRRELLSEIALKGAKSTFSLRNGGSAEASEYFDLQHFAYLEDIDLSYRARLFGYRIRYCPEAEVYHVGSGTSGSKYNSFKVRLAARNNVYLNYKNMPALQLLINLPGILAGVLIKQAFFARIGFGKDYRNGFFEGLRTLRSCRRVPFAFARLPRYLKIEWQLFAGCFEYAADFFARKLRKNKSAGKTAAGRTFRERERDEIQN